MPKIKRLKETQTGKLTFGSGTAVVASLQWPLFARFQGFPPSTEVRFFFLVFRVFVVVSLIFRPLHFSSHLPFYILQLGFQFGLWWSRRGVSTNFFRDAQIRIVLFDVRFGNGKTDLCTFFLYSVSILFWAFLNFLLPCWFTLLLLQWNLEKAWVTFGSQTSWFWASCYGLMLAWKWCCILLMSIILQVLRMDSCCSKVMDWYEILYRPFAYICCSQIDSVVSVYWLDRFGNNLTSVLPCCKIWLFSVWTNDFWQGLWWIGVCMLWSAGCCCNSVVQTDAS